jgi:FOG: CheY-like receiver
METRSILYIDYDKTSHILISNILFDKNIEILHAYNGMEAIDIFIQNPSLNLVITELMVPDMDGFNILKTIRKLNPLIPVIACSAYTMLDMNNRCLEEGFNCFIEKPITIEAFSNKVDVCLNYTEKNNS